VYYHKLNKLDLSLFNKLNHKRYPFLLESVASCENNNYDILFAFPAKSIVTNDDFLSKIPKIKTQKNPHNLPFVGGYFVYLGYELAGEIEPVLNLPQNKLPNYLVEIGSAIINNHTTNESFILSDNKEHFELIKQDVSNLGKVEIKNIYADITPPDDKTFQEMVKTCKNYIIAGDIFQANLSRKWQAKLRNNPDTIDIYHKLRKVNPAPFSAFASFAGFEIISSSPERLFSVENNIIQTRPIAGTRPRGDKISDDKLKTELSTNLKEQAEHLMLLDLERNDLGRVCEYGSVKVDEVMSIESYAFVHHIVSNISGKLKKNTTFADIITALFPGGTITGCPKIRSMQIIAELENKPRDAYTGSLGYISNCGKMDFNILIRTIIKQNDDISISAGAGIVYDSDPEKETLETEHKAIGMLKVFN
jgi:anthranilate synthase component 1